MRIEDVDFENMKEKSLERINFIQNDLQSKIERKLEAKSTVPVFIDKETLTEEEMIEGDIYEG